MIHTQRKERRHYAPASRAEAAYSGSRHYIVERALKRAILHRKNALFYKTENGADAGDVFMTLIHTAELSGVNPFKYLTELLRHPREVADSADAWLPWNFHRAVESRRQAAAG